MKKIKEILLYTNWRNIFFALLGSAILAFGTNYIYANSQIPEGGIMGVCLIIEHFTGIHPSISNILITLFCYMLAWRLMGTRYILNASVATLGFSLFYAIFSSPALDNLIPSMAEYPLIAALIGAILVEVGTGLTHRFGSAPSGEQALTMAIVKRGSFNLAWIQFIRDFIVLSIPLLYIDEPMNAVYAIIIMALTTPITDHIVNAPKNVRFTKRVKRTHKSWLPIVIIGLILSLIMTAILIYVNEVYMPTDDVAAYASSQGIEDGFTVEHLVDDTKHDPNVTDNAYATAYLPMGEIKAGFVFYPGGKVDCEAYAPLLMECASRGILCVVVEMPFNLAVFGINKGAEIIEQFPKVESWYIGGHSLGGSMAASCAANHSDLFDGVVLLASYSTVDITNLRVLSIYGTNDEVMETRNYEKYENNLPDIFSGNFTERVISGGNHSYFGMYGSQKGDGEATVTNVEQIKFAADEIVKFIAE